MNTTIILTDAIPGFKSNALFTSFTSGFMKFEIDFTNFLQGDMNTESSKLLIEFNSEKVDIWFELMSSASQSRQSSLSIEKIDKDKQSTYLLACNNYIYESVMYIVKGP